MAKETDTGSRGKTVSLSTARSRSAARRWERAKEAYDLRLEGRSLSEICEILQAKPEDVARLLDELYGFEAAYLTDQERKTALATEVARLDKLQVAFWQSAMMGDVQSGRMVLDAIKTRVDITGLKEVDPIVQKNLVLVMGDREEDYIKQLQDASE